MSDYTPTGAPTDQTRGASGTIRSEFQAVATAMATKSDTAGETYSGTHDFTGATLIAPGKSDVAGETYSGTHNFSGATVVVATQVSSDNSTNPASTAFVQAAVSPIAGSNATSTSSLTIGTGAKSLTIQTGKSIVVGMTLVIARTSAPTTTRMSGVVTSYDSGTGALGVTVDSVTGSGTHTDWTVSLSAAVIGSDLAKRVIQVKVIDDATTLTTGDGKVIFLIPQELNGYNLVGANAFVTTVSSSGTPTVQIRNVTDAVDMLSTRITIDANEYTSYTAAAAAVVNATYDDVATGDRLAVDVDVAGTGAKGLGIVLTFQLP